jgi:hypothetical protein
MKVLPCINIYIYNQTSIQQSHWDKSAKTVLPVPVRNDNGTYLFVYSPFAMLSHD